MKTYSLTLALLLVAIFAIVSRIELSEVRSQLQLQQEELGTARSNLNACRGTYFSQQ